MWNREDARRTSGHADQRTLVSATPVRRPHEAPEIRVATLGSSVCVNGELSGSEDVRVDGRVEGRVDLPDHTLTIGPHGQIHADIVANVVTVFGTVVGGVRARSKVDIRQGGSVEGPLACPRLAIEDGAHFCGHVEMAIHQAGPLAAETRHATPALPAVV